MAIPAIVANVVNALYNIVNSNFYWARGRLLRECKNKYCPFRLQSLHGDWIIGLYQCCIKSFNWRWAERETGMLVESRWDAWKALACCYYCECGSIVLQLTIELIWCYRSTRVQWVCRNCAFRIPAPSWFRFLVLIHWFVRRWGHLLDDGHYWWGAPLNTILDPLFIFGFNMGYLLGAVWATVISQVVSALKSHFAYIPRFRSVFSLWSLQRGL